MAYVGEALVGEESEGFPVAGYGSHAEDLYSSVLGFGDDCFHEGFADAFSSVGLADDGWFHFCFFAFPHEACQGDDCAVVGYDP